MATVLVVEDGLTDMQILTRYLQQAGYTVIGATNTEEAEDKIGLHNPSLIIMDVILPGKSGFELCRELKNNPKTSAIPVIFCSTKNTEVDRIWANMLGAEAFIAKPIKKEELEMALRKISQ